MAEATCGLLVNDDGNAGPRPFDGDFLNSIHERGAFLWMQTSRSAGARDLPDAVRHLPSNSVGINGACIAEIGRDPASISRFIHLPVSYDHPSNTRDSIAEAIDVGFQHIVLGLPAPYPENVARWVTNELINKLA